MTVIKKIWITPNLETDQYNISIRCNSFNPDVPRLVHNYLELPPNAEKGHDRIGIDEARRKGISEEHHTLFGMSAQDLLILYTAIGERLKEDYPDFKF